MAYNSFFTNILIRFSALVITLTGLVYLFVIKDRFFSILFLGLITIIQIILLFSYLNRTNRNLARFLMLLTEEDTSVTLWKDRVEKTFRGLHHSFKKVNDEISRIKLEKEKGTILLQNIIDHVSVGILAIDESGKVEIVNAAVLKTFGISKLNRFDDLDLLQNGMARLLSNLRYECGNIIHYKNDDYETTPLLVKVSLFSLGEKTLKLFSIQSIKTELEAREIESWQQMTRVLAHEISNSVTPITTLGANLHRKLLRGNKDKDVTMKLKKEAAKDLIQSAEIIEIRGNALIEFIEHYKSFTRLPEPVIEKVNLSRIFDNISRFFKEELERHNIKLKIDITEQPLYINVDPNLLDQALINLLRNSIYVLADNPGGLISLKANQLSEDEITLEIADNGPGIPPEIQNQVFIPFFTTRPKGTGIGLSIVKKIVHMHGGTIHFRTEPGKGTTFIIKLRAR